MADDTNVLDPQEVAKRLQLHSLIFGNPLSNLGAVAGKTPTPAPPQDEQDMSNLRDALTAPRPKESDYEPSLGRKILGNTLGYLIALKHPQQGMALKDQIEHPQYFKDTSEYQKNIDQAQNLVSLDTSQRQEKAKETESEARTEAEKARSGAEEAREAYNRFRVSNPTSSKETIVNPKEWTKIKLKDGKIVSALKKGDNWVRADGTTVTPDSVDDIVDEQKPPTGDPLTRAYDTNKISELIQKYGSIDKIPSDDLQKAITARSPQGGGVADARVNELLSVTALDEVRKQLASANEMSPDDVEHAKTVLASDPRKISTYNAEQVAQLQKAGVNVPRKLDSAQNAKLDAAEITLSKIKGIRKALMDPRLKANIGVIAGNLGRVANFVGTDMFNGDRETQRAAQKLRSDLGYLMLNEATLFKNSPSAQLLSRIDKMTPQSRYDSSLFEGALASAEDNASSTRQQMYHAMGVEPKEDENKKEDFVVMSDPKGNKYKVKSSEVEIRKKRGWKDAQ